MALTYTPTDKLNTNLPSFRGKDVFGQYLEIPKWAEHNPLVVMFICNHCPYVKAIEDRLIEHAIGYQKKGVKFIAICSNDPTDYAEDLPENLRKRAQEKSYPFPYLIDEDQSIAREFGAVCTPDLFVFGADQKLKYRGRLDDSWKDPGKVLSHDLARALDAILAQKPVPFPQHPSMGCSIKWRSH